MDQFAKEHPSGESGGFLVGKKRNLKSLEEYEIVVDQFVPVTQTRGGASRFALTKDHFQALQRSLQASGSDLRIVGWMHSHPGFGVFLSAFDKQQHERLFARPWHIAYVIDAQLGERALYHCVDHIWRELPGYYILRSEYAGVEKGRPRTRPARLGAALLLLALLITAGVYGYNWYNERFRQPAKPATLENAEPVTTPLRGQSVVTVTPAPARVETAAPQQPPQPAQQPQQQGQPQAPQPAQPRQYVVSRGDTLWDIAEKVYGDGSLYRLIVEANNISNPSQVRTGTVLVIPEAPTQ